MIRKITLLVLVALIVGCGGGGGSSTGPKIVGTVTAIVESDTDTVLSLEGSEVLVPSGALPVGSAVELKLIDDPKPFPNDKAFPTFYKVEVSTDAQPTENLSVKVPKPQGSNPFNVALLVTNGWDIIDHEIVDNFIVFKLPVASQAPTQDGRAIGFQWISQVVNTLNEVQAFWQPNLQRLHGTGHLGQGKSALIIHGVFSKADKFKDFGRKLYENTQLGYTNVYGVNYDYRYGVIKNAEAIRSLVNNYLPAPGAKKIDIYAHSMGGLVSRYFLEELNYTHPFSNLVTMHTPHAGAGLGTVAQAATTLNRLLLNSPSSLLTGGLLTPAHQCAQDLTTNSGVLSTLKYSMKSELGQVGYALVGASADVIVPLASQLAEDTEMRGKTSGMVQREAVVSPGSLNPLSTHSYLYSNIHGITVVAGTVVPRTGEGLELTSDALVVDAGSLPYWDYSFRIRNTSTVSVRIDDIEVESYDRYGAHNLTQWYRTIPGTLPTVYTEWGEVVSPNDYRDIALRFNTGSELNGTLFTGSSIIHCRYRLNNVSYVKRLTFRLTREGEMPVLPVTRQRDDGSPTSQGIAVVSVVK